MRDTADVSAQRTLINDFLIHHVFVLLVNNAQQVDSAQAGDWRISMLHGRATRPPADLGRGQPVAA
jgi:hypothetical protein